MCMVQGRKVSDCGVEFSVEFSGQIGSGLVQDRPGNRAGDRTSVTKWKSFFHDREGVCPVEIMRKLAEV